MAWHAVRAFDAAGPLISRSRGSCVRFASGSDPPTADPSFAARNRAIKMANATRTFLSDLHCLSPVPVRVHPAIGRDFLLFGEPNDMHGRRVPSLLQDLHFSAASNFHIGVSRGRRIASSGKLARDFKPSKSRHLGVRKYRFGFGITSKRNLSVRAALRFAHAFVFARAPQTATRLRR